MFRFSFKGVSEQSDSPCLILKMIKSKGLTLGKVELYRNNELITVNDFNYYLDLYQNCI